MSTRCLHSAEDLADQGNPTCQEYAPCWENTTCEDNYTRQETTEYGGTVTNQNIIAETSTLKTTLPETTREGIEAIFSETSTLKAILLETIKEDIEAIFSKTSILQATLPETTKDVEERVKQLAAEFSAHINAELKDGAKRDFIEKWIQYYVTTHDETAVREALQAVAATLAAHIHNHFGKELQKEIPIAIAAPWRAQLGSSKLETETEYQDFLEDFTAQHLPLFYDSNNKMVQKVASKAAKRVREEMGISHKLIPGLAKLALYDFIFLCDDSGSMNEEDRILALRDTLGRVAKFATILSSSGISIRMLNYKGDGNGSWDHLSTVDDVIRKMDKVWYIGGTPLGTRLWEKILGPLIIDKASLGKLEKPVIVVIITDGETNNENPTELRNRIWRCNEKMRKLGYRDAAVVFLISRVGTSEDARVFVEGLGKDEYIGKTVYVSPADLQLKRAAFQNSGNDVAYTEMLIQLFLAALHVRTQNQRDADSGGQAE